MNDAQGGIAQISPEILEEPIPLLDRGGKIFFGGKILFFLLECLFGFRLLCKNTTLKVLIFLGLFQICKLWRCFMNPPIFMSLG